VQLSTGHQIEDMHGQANYTLYLWCCHQRRDTTDIYNQHT